MPTRQIWTAAKISHRRCSCGQGRDTGKGTQGEYDTRLLCVAVLAYNLARGLDSSLPVAFLLGYIGCEAFGRYGARRERAMLVTGILGAVGALCAVTLYVANTL